MTDITIKIKTKDLIVKNGDRFLISQEGEEALVKFYRLKKKVDEVDAKVKELIKKRMEEEKITRVEGGRIKIVKRYFGPKYKITDPKIAKKRGYGKEYVMPDSEKIDVILENEGKLPEGIELNDKRQEQVVISLVEKNE